MREADKLTICNSFICALFALIASVVSPNAAPAIFPDVPAAFEDSVVDFAQFRRGWGTGMQPRFAPAPHRQFAPAPHRQFAPSPNRQSAPSQQQQNLIQQQRQRVNQQRTFQQQRIEAIRQGRAREIARLNQIRIQQRNALEKQKKFLEDQRQYFQTRRQRPIEARNAAHSTSITSTPAIGAAVKQQSVTAASLLVAGGILTPNLHERINKLSTANSAETMHGGHSLVDRSEHDNVNQDTNVDPKVRIKNNSTGEFNALIPDKDRQTIEYNARISERNRSRILQVSPPDRLSSIAASATASDASGTLFTKIVPSGGLTSHERAGGHLLLKHVGQNESQLIARLASEPGISGSSSFYDRASAERAVVDTLNANSEKISDWLSSSKKKMKIEHTSRDSVGLFVLSGASEAVKVNSTRLILVRDLDMLHGYRILTGFPTEP